MAADFSEYTYDVVLEQLQTLLAQKGTWTQFNEAGIGETLLEAVALICDKLHYNLERRVEENYITTAKLRSSIVALAKLVGYTPRRKVSATGSVKFSLSAGYWDSHGSSVDIPVDTVVSNGSTVFVTTEAASLGVGVYETGWVSVKQGTRKEIQQTGDGTSSQYVDIPNSGEDVDAVEETSIEVYVDDVLWTEVDTFYDGTTTDADGSTVAKNCYVVERFANYLRIWFGDAVNGKIPPNGSTIEVKWIETDGSGGNIIAPDMITATTHGNSSISVSDSTAMTGGEEEESTEEIRRNAPLVWSSQGRCVTRQDYIGYISSLPGVEAVNVWGEEEELAGESSNADYAWRIIIAAVPEDSTESNYDLSGSGLADDIDTALDSRKPVTTWITWVSPIPVRLMVTGRVRVSSSSILSTVEAAIKSNISGNYSSWSNLEFETTARLGDIINYIEETDGVEWSEGIELKHWKSAGTGDGSETTFTASFDYLPTPNRVEVLLRTGTSDNYQWSVVGIDDGNGVITGDNLIGTVDYVDKDVSVTFSSPVDSGTEVIIATIGAEHLTEDVFVVDGATTTFRAVLKHPIVPLQGSYTRFQISYRIGSVSYTATDDGNGNITGDYISSGTIDYERGLLLLTFTVAPEAGSPIEIDYYAGTGNYSSEKQYVLVLPSNAIVPTVSYMASST